MPSIIPSPGTPGIAVNTTATLLIDHDYTVAANQKFYANGLGVLMQTSGLQFPYYALTNAGLLWSQNSSGNAFVVSAFNFGLITNSGKMVAHSSGGAATAIKVDSTFAGLTNSGQIFAISTAAGAYGVRDWAGSGNEIINSGLIAAQGPTAVAIARYNGGEVVNAAGGQILAEGANATAIFLGRGHVGAWDHPDIDNAGTIRAVSTGANASVGIYASALESEELRIVNSGTISADVAIYIDDYQFSPPQKSGQYIVNTANGAIVGDIYLASGSDFVGNAGTITGYVDMGQGDDVFDNTGGVVHGTVDLSWGDDVYQGGAAADAAVGGRGQDILHGDGGADLLFGGRGDDFIYGEAGNDGLYGDGGDDVIVTQAGDKADGGFGDDRVVLGDYAFASVDGGSGFDVLELAPGPRVLDLQAALASGRVLHFDEIALPGAQELVIRPGDVQTLTGGATLIVSTVAAATVDLVGAWTAQGPVTVGGVSYGSWSLNGVTVLVSGAGMVGVVGAAPVGAAGLDAVAAGAAAPLPGSVAGAVLSSSNTNTRFYDLTSTLVIDNDESWFSTTGYSVLNGNDPNVDLINNGEITSSGGVEGARAVSVGTMHDIVNNGAMTAVSAGDPADLTFNLNYVSLYSLDVVFSNLPDGVFGLYVGSGVNAVRNNGLITATSDVAAAVGYNTWGTPGRNDGTISASSTSLMAAGVFAHNGGELINTGHITADGKIGAIGVGAADWGLSLINSGDITATTHTAGKPSIGVYTYYQMGESRIINTGTITADIAIQTTWMVNGGGLFLDNSGQINGLIELNVVPNGGPTRQDVVLNRGTINGDVLLGGERDIFVGAGGTQTGTVYGQDGADLLVGGAGGDKLDGGAGDDAIRGGGGADTLTGGAGSDLFIYAAAGESTAAAFDVITDFQSGVDRIDVGALAPSQILFAVNGGVTTVTVTGTGGQLVVHVTGTVLLTDFLTGQATSQVGGPGGDIMVASAVGTALQGMDGDDLLVGDAGADRLDGGAGYDLMTGGLGDDLYVIDDNDTLRELAGQGTDTVEAHFSQYVPYYVLPDNIENLVLVTGVHGSGNALDNRITGNAAANTLVAHLGIDTLVGGGGNDTYEVDDSRDVIIELAGEGTDLVRATVSFQLSNNVENLTLQGYDDIDGAGNGQANILYGNNGRNSILAGGGGDTVYAGWGNDQAWGGEGDDLIFGDPGQDLLYGEGGADTLRGDGLADVIYGGEGDDIISGTSAYIFDGIGGYWRPAQGEDYAADTLFGGAGADLLEGGGGADLLYGGSGRDIANYRIASTEATWSRNVDGTWTVNAGTETGVDILTGVEVLRFTDRDVALGPASEVRTDFNGDGKSDVLWRNDNGELYVWNSQSGQGAFLGQSLGNPGAAWHVAATGDYDGDGKADVLWRNTNGNLYVYRSDDGAAVSFTGQSIAYVDPIWAMVPDSGDFDGDGRADILFRNSNTGEVYLWNSNTVSDVSFLGQSLGFVGSDWAIQGIDDFNGDGRSDVLWRNTAGDVYIWKASGDGPVTMSGQTISSVGNDWSIIGTGDFNGDGRADILWRHAGDGELYVWNSSTTNAAVNFRGQSVGVVGMDWSVAAVGDYDGDGRTDVLFRNADGRVYVWNSNDTGAVGFVGQGLGSTPNDWHILSDGSYILPGG